MAINKVVFGGDVLIDLSSDTVTADKVAEGITFHGKDGTIGTGSSTLDSDTHDATAAVAEIIKGKTAYVRGAKITGTMPSNGAVSATIKGKNEEYTIPIGFHDGSGKVGIDAVEKNKLIAENIRQGITILGVPGSMSGSEGVKAQSKTVTPTKEGLTVTPDPGYTHLSEVVVNKIPYELSENTAGGQTATIG